MADTVTADSIAAAVMFNQKKPQKIHPRIAR
jgi:hypothetical protein